MPAWNSALPLQNPHNPLHIAGKQLVQSTCSGRNLKKFSRLFSPVRPKRRKWVLRRRTGASRLRRSAPPSGANGLPGLGNWSDSPPALTFVSSPLRMATTRGWPRLTLHGAGLSKDKGTPVTMTASFTRRRGKAAGRPRRQLFGECAILLVSRSAAIPMKRGADTISDLFELTQRSTTSLGAERKR